MIASNLIMLDSPRSSTQPAAVSAAINEAPSMDNEEVMEEEIKVEDIPF